MINPVQRPARNRQDLARQPPARPAAATGRTRGPGGGGDPVGCGFQTAGLLATAAVSPSSSFGIRAGIGRRWLASDARRNHPGPSRRPVPGRTAGVRTPRAGSAARTAGIRRDRGGASSGPGAFSGALPIGSGDESLPLWISRRPYRALPLQQRDGPAVPQQALRPTAGPHRPASHRRPRSDGTVTDAFRRPR